MSNQEQSHSAQRAPEAGDGTREETTTCPRCGAQPAKIRFHNGAIVDGYECASWPTSEESPQCTIRQLTADLAAARREVADLRAAILAAVLTGPRPICGERALMAARVIHAAGLELSPAQWGNAYFLCPACGQARDCTGSESCPDCDADMGLADLRISEGWVERACAESARQEPQREVQELQLALDLTDPVIAKLTEERNAAVEAQTLAETELEDMQAALDRQSAIIDELRAFACEACGDGKSRTPAGLHDDGDECSSCLAWTDLERAEWTASRADRQPQEPQP